MSAEPKFGRFGSGREVKRIEDPALVRGLGKFVDDVILVDQQRFPRDKVCGDGLIPDAHRALRRLGVLDEVMQQAEPVRHVRCIGPRGGHVDVPGTLAVALSCAVDRAVP